MPLCALYITLTGDTTIVLIGIILPRLLGAGAVYLYGCRGFLKGALYLDETAHSFRTTLPETSMPNDFTIQFRYYQAIRLLRRRIVILILVVSRFSVSGGYPKWLRCAAGKNSGRLLNENCYYAVWCESLLLFEWPLIGSVAAPVSSFSMIFFLRWRISKQTFKIFDELRVTNYAIAQGGAFLYAYAVPMTNLLLVLPDP